MKGKGGWTGPAFTFTAEAEQEIRRAFGSRFPEVERAAFLRRMAGAMTKLASDKGEPARPRTARKGAKDRAEKVAELLSKAAAEIGKIMKTEAELLAELLAKNGKVTELGSKQIAELAKMYETERDLFDLAVSGNPVALTDVVETLEKAAMGFRRAADGHALGRGEKVAGSDAKALFVAAQAAVAWRAAFGVEPTHNDKADFVIAVDAILDAVGMSSLGSDAIETAIKGPPKSRKS